MPPADPLARISERVEKVRREHAAWQPRGVESRWCSPCNCYWPCPILKLAEDLLVAVEALKPFAEFYRQWSRQPMRGVDNEFYAIHTGTEYAASLRLSDCEDALLALSRIAAGSGEGS